MKHIILLFACFSMAFSVNLSAQNVAGSVEVGVYSAYQFTQFSGGVFEEPNAKLYDIPFSSYGITAGATAELHITPTFALLGILRYESLHARKYLEDTIMSRLQDGTEISTNIYHEYIILAPQFAVTICGKFTMPGTRLNVLGGVTVGVLSKDKEVEQLGLLIDDNRPVWGGYVDSTTYYPYGIQYRGVKGQKPYFANETRTAIRLYEDPIYQRTALQLGFTAGLQYDLPIYTLDEGAQKFVTITPSVLFNYNLTTYSDYEKLRAWNVSAGFVLKVGL